jgi:hypothetical protein
VDNQQLIFNGIVIEFADTPFCGSLDGARAVLSHHLVYGPIAISGVVRAEGVMPDPMDATTMAALSVPNIPTCFIWAVEPSHIPRIPVTSSGTSVAGTWPSGECEITTPSITHYRFRTPVSGTLKTRFGGSEKCASCWCTGTHFGSFQLPHATAIHRSSIDLSGK